MLPKISKLGLPLKLVLVLLLVAFFGDYLSADIKSYAYGLSLLLKEMLLFVMPLIIFAYIFSCLVSFKGSSVTFFASLLGSVCLSNFISTMIAFGISFYTLGHLMNRYDIQSEITDGLTLLPAFDLHFPKLISNDIALFSGLILGVVCSFYEHPVINKASDKLKNSANFVLNRVFVPVLPFFILGFVLKMQYEGNLSIALNTYGPIVFVFATCQIFYLILLYGIGSNFKRVKWLMSLRNILPATFTGFTAMSSLAAMPLTLRASNKNTDDHPMVGVIVPSTVNIHLMGDSIAIPVIAIAILLDKGGAFPDFSSYLIFALYFIVNKFAVAAVPGGGILVMLPVLSAYLGFTDEMLSLITMLYILFDPIITAVNVTGNGAFAVIFTKIFGRK